MNTTQLSSGEQIDLFQKDTSEKNVSEDLSQKRLWNEFVAKHPFMFHILRVDDKGLFHINTIYKDYNDSHYPKEPYENRLTKYSYCDNIEDVMMLRPRERPGIHYAIVSVDYKQIKELKNYHD